MKYFKSLSIMCIFLSTIEGYAQGTIVRPSKSVSSPIKPQISPSMSENTDTKISDLLTRKMCHTNISVFFDINSSMLKSKKDIINLEAVATAVKNTDSELVVIGSADGKNGNSSVYNQKLSEVYAQAVANELVNLGVDRHKIEVLGIGGVNELVPHDLNRRAIVAFRGNVIRIPPISVFFDINSSKLNSKKDIINLEAVAAAAKNNGAKLLVVGSVDSKTGSSAYNQKLSEARAQAVADELVNLGIDRANIEVKGVGGVDEVVPFNLNNRAVVLVK